MRISKWLLFYLILLLVSATSASVKVRYDFDGDRRTDPTVITSFNQYLWYTLKSTGGISTTAWGTGSSSFSDWSVAADYDGDGKTDIAVWREFYPQPTPEFGDQAFFYILYSATGTYGVIPWGRSRNNNFMDFPLRGDFDGDGREDVAISRGMFSQKKYFYILQSRDGPRVEQFGNSPDVHVPGDYDGDGKADLAVARPLCYVDFSCQYEFYIKRSSDLTLQVRQFGYVRSDYTIGNADFDGDGKTDIAVWGGNSQGGGFGVWSWIRSSDGAAESVRWGFNEVTDTPAQGDYDGDGTTDIAIHRNTRFGACDDPKYFWIRGSTMGTQVIQWGTCHGHPWPND